MAQAAAALLHVLPVLQERCGAATRALSALLACPGAGLNVSSGFGVKHIVPVQQERCGAATRARIALPRPPSCEH